MIITHHVTSVFRRLHEIVATKLRSYLRSSSVRCLVVGCSNQAKVDDREAIEEIVEGEQASGLLHMIDSDEVNSREIQQALRDLDYGEKLVLLCDSDNLHRVIKQFNCYDYELLVSPRAENFVAVRFDAKAKTSDMALAS